jgi:CheY-like chemotaxis protein
MEKINCIMLVDDDKSANFISQTVIKKLDCANQVITAQNGREALDTLYEYCLQQAHQECPQLILLDIKMPVMDGFEFLEEFEGIPWPEDKQKPIVVLLTTSSSPIDLQLAQEHNLADFMLKPLNKEKMTSLVQKHFQPRKDDINYDKAV